EEAGAWRDDGRSLEDADSAVDGSEDDRQTGRGGGMFCRDEEVDRHLMSDLARPSPCLTVLVIDDEPGIRKALAACLESDGHDVVAVSNGKDALTATTRKSFDLVFVDIQLGDHSGMDLIPALLAESPWLKIIVITAYASIDTAVESIKR